MNFLIMHCMICMTTSCHWRLWNPVCISLEASISTSRNTKEKHYIMTFGDKGRWFSFEMPFVLTPSYAYAVLTSMLMRVMLTLHTSLQPVIWPFTLFHFMFLLSSYACFIILLLSCVGLIILLMVWQCRKFCTSRIYSCKLRLLYSAYIPKL